MADTSPTRPARTAEADETPKNDLSALLRHVQTHPGLYAGSMLFVLAVLVITGVYRLTQSAAHETASTEFLRALDIEAPEQRAAALGTIAEGGGSFAARALYLQGETLLESGDADAAKAVFVKLRDEHADFEFVPEAVEALGLIAEDAGRYPQARTLYEEISSKWPETAAAKRQPFNVARCFEGEKDLAQAVEQYRKQLETFPGSTIAQRAQLRLDELRAEHPELFPAEPVAVETSEDPVAASATAPSAEVPADATQTPAPEAAATPAAETPAAETAPAPDAEIPATPQE